MIAALRAACHERRRSKKQNDKNGAPLRALITRRLKRLVLGGMENENANELNRKRIGTGPNMTPKNTIILFDVNETLLDLHDLDNSFDAMFASPYARSDWFKQLLQLSLLANTLEDYCDFSVLSGRALTMVAEQRGRTLNEKESQSILTAIRGLRPHKDVEPALDLLVASGFRLATLTNSPSATLEAQLANAGLTDRFERRLSVDAVRRYKPARETYHYAARESWACRSDRSLWWPLTAGTYSGHCEREQRPPSSLGRDRFS